MDLLSFVEKILPERKTSRFLVGWYAIYPGWFTIGSFGDGDSRCEARWFIGTEFCSWESLVLVGRLCFYWT